MLKAARSLAICGSCCSSFFPLQEILQNLLHWQIQTPASGGSNEEPLRPWDTGTTIKLLRAELMPSNELVVYDTSTPVQLSKPSFSFFLDVAPTFQGFGHLDPDENTKGRNCGLFCLLPALQPSNCWRNANIGRPDFNSPPKSSVQHELLVLRKFVIHSDFLLSNDKLFLFFLPEPGVENR